MFPLFPERKVTLRPIVRQPIWLAYSTARRTFGLLPLPLMAISTSPEAAKFFKGSTNTDS